MSKTRWDLLKITEMDFMVDTFIMRAIKKKPKICQTDVLRHQADYSRRLTTVKSEDCQADYSRRLTTVKSEDCPVHVSVYYASCWKLAREAC